MDEREPQLRLTRTPDANINNGIWTDFQTTNLGDLFIHPSANGGNRFVGINTAAPQTELDVNGAITAHKIIINDNAKTIDLLALVEDLKKEVTELKQQMTALKN
jgi:hypothetical protein